MNQPATSPPHITRSNLPNFPSIAYHSSSVNGPRISTTFTQSPLNNANVHISSNSGPIAHRAPTLDRLSYDEIEKELQKLSIEIPLDFWKAPKSEDVQGLFSKALEEVFLIKENDIRAEEVTGEVVQHFEGGEGMQLLSYEGKLHLRAIGNLRFFRYCQRLCWEILGVSSFNRDYLFKPTPHTTLTFATAFAQFLRFREWIYQEHTELFNELEKKLKEGEYFDKNILRLQMELNQIQLMIEENHMEIKERRNLYDQWREKLSNLDISYSETKAQLDEIENSLKNLTQKENSSSVELQNAQAESAVLRSKIVHNPEQFIKAESELLKKLNMAIEAVEKGNIDIQGYTQKLKLMEKAKRRLKKVEEIINDQFEPIFQKIIMERDALKQTRMQLHSLEITHTKYQVQYETYTESVRTLTQQLEDNKREWEMKIRTSREELKKLHSDHQKHREALHIEQTALKDLSEKSEQIVTHMKKLEEQHHNVLENMDNQIEALYACREKFQNELEKLRKSLPIGWDIHTEEVEDLKSELDYSQYDSDLLHTEATKRMWKDAEEGETDPPFKSDASPKMESSNENRPNLLNFRNLWKHN